jgi:hypothetical protein
MLSPCVVSRLSLTLVALAGLATAAQGGFVSVSQPNASYLASTAKFAIPNSGPALSSLTERDLTITFSKPMTPFAAGRIRWGNPPVVEDSAPTTLYSQQQSSRVLTFSQPLQTFGAEMLPNFTVFFPATLTAQFFDGTTLVGTIHRSVSEFGPARLFAGTDTDIPFTSVQLSSPSSTFGFFIADVRAEIATPEPASLGLFGPALLGVIGYGWRRRAGGRGLRG